MTSSPARTRPTLLSSCAMAATAAEARYRIPILDPGRRASRLIALDPGATSIAQRLGTTAWGEHIPVLVPTADGADSTSDVLLRAADGTTVQASDTIADADLVVVVATVDDGAAIASVIAAHANQRRIMMMGVVVGDGSETMSTVAALRPHARVLLVSDDENDVLDVLTALRA